MPRIERIITLAAIATAPVTARKGSITVCVLGVVAAAAPWGGLAVRCWSSWHRSRS